jgi:hypothetical protein
VLNGIRPQRYDNFPVPQNYSAKKAGVREISLKGNEKNWRAPKKILLLRKITEQQAASTLPQRAPTKRHPNIFR